MSAQVNISGFALRPKPSVMRDLGAERAPGYTVRMDDNIASNSNAGAAMDRRIERPHAARRKWIIRGSLALLAIVGAAALYWVIPGSDTLRIDSEAIRTGTVERAPFQDYVPLRAEVVPLDTVYITAVQGGQVDRVIASDGGLIARGQPLAQLTNPALELEVASRSADIAGQLSNISGQRLSVQRNRLDSDQDVAAARNALLKVEHDYRVKKFLFDKDIVNEAALEPLENELAFQREQVDALQESRSQERAVIADQVARIGDTAGQLRASLAMVRGSLSALTLRAPVAGRLTAFALQPGQAVNPGDPIGQIDSEGAWKLKAEVDQFYLGRTTTGQTALAEIDGRVFQLTVTKVLPQVTDGRFVVEFGFNGDVPSGINRGQTLDVRLILGADKPAIVAPTGGWIDAGGGTAFVLSKDGSRAIRRAIATDRRNPEQVEITSGLAPGERIITTAIGDYTPYQTLIVR